MASYKLSEVRNATDVEIAVMFEHLYDSKQYADWVKPLAKSEVFDDERCIKNWSEKMTVKQISNYKRIAVYLDCLPSNYHCFDMGEYLSIAHESTSLLTAALEIFTNILEDNDDTTIHDYSAKHNCQTVGCALGHAIDAGCYDLKDNDNNLTWGDLEKQAFGIHIYNEDASGDVYEWIFNGKWCDVDNTKQGVVFRILFMFKHGVPEHKYTHIWIHYDQVVNDN